MKDFITHSIRSLGEAFAAFAIACAAAFLFSLAVRFGIFLFAG